MTRPASTTDDEFRAHFAHVQQLLAEYQPTEQWREFLFELVNDRVPEKFPKLTNLFDSWKVRDILKFYGMYAIVDRTWTKRLADELVVRFGEDVRVLEVMAGRGWLAAALQGHGVNVRAYDDYSWAESGLMYEGTVTTVIRHDAVDAARTLRDDYDVLLMSWPPYDEPQGYETIKAWGPDKPIVVIGEGRSGCTANADFHDHFLGVPLDVDMPRWPSMHDYVQIGLYTAESQKPQWLTEHEAEMAEWFAEEEGDA